MALRPVSERYDYGAATSFPKLSDYASEEEKLRKLYDQARAQGNKKKKKEYKEKIAELNRLRKYGQREGNRLKSKVFLVLFFLKNQAAVKHAVDAGTKEALDRPKTSARASQLQRI